MSPAPFHDIASKMLPSTSFSTIRMSLAQPVSNSVLPFLVQFWTRPSFISFVIGSNVGKMDLIMDLIVCPDCRVLYRGTKTGMLENKEPGI